MFSKRILNLSVLLAATLMTTACAKFFESKKETSANENEQYVINAKEAEGLKEVPGLFGSYFKDELPAEKVDLPFQHIRAALSAFGKYTRGENEDFYTAAELQKFLNKYLLKQNQVSDDFMLEIMRLKVVGVGGSVDTISRYELQKVDEILAITAQKAALARGQMRLLLFQLDKKSLSSAQLDRAEALVQDLIMSFLAKTKLVGSDYEFNNFKEFIRQLGAFLGQPESFGKFQEWMPIVETSKNLFLGEVSRAKSPAEFRALASWIVRLYGLGLRSYYQIDHIDLKSAQGWPELFGNIDRALDLLRDAPVVKEGTGFSCVDLDQLIDLLLKNKLFDLKLDAELIKTTYRKFVLFVLESRSTSRRSLSELISVNASHISVLREEYEVFKASQNFLVKEFSKQNEISILRLSDSVSSYNLGPQLGTLEASKRQIVLQSWQDFAQLLRQRPVTALDKNLRLQIGPQSLNTIVTFESTTVMNAIRSLARLVLKAYGDGKTSSVNLFGQNITIDGMVHFEQDFQDFGRAVKFLDPRIEGPAKRAFKEGNFFAFHGNGDDLLTSTELYELFNFMISAGLSGAHEVQADLDKIPGCLTGRKDPFDENIATLNCFTLQFNGNYSKYLQNLPGLVNYLNHLSEANRNQFFGTLVYVSKLSDPNPTVFEFSEIRTMIGISQYVESVVYAYDGNRDGLFTEDELLAAYNGRFKSFFDPIAAKEGAFEWMYDDAFLYLVYNGKKPTATELVQFIAQRQFGLGVANRTNILMTLGVLKAELAKIAKVRVEVTE